MQTLAIDRFLEAVRDGSVLLDVRTPSEYEHAHHPSAVNLPIFDDRERAEIGTIYKQNGRVSAIRAGLDRVGPRMGDIVDAVERIAGPPGARGVAVHCWRGGMRSASVAWLLDLVGWDVAVLDGGYKAFRRWVLARLERIPPLHVLGGRTGSGKTDVLAALAEQGAAVIDLEELANHRGSAFGAVERPPQPSQEQFEALLALALDDCGEQSIWIEDESRMIGSCKIPDALMTALRSSDVHVLRADEPSRVRRLVDIYGTASTDELRVCFERIRKRLGPQRTTEAVAALNAGELAIAAQIALDYYDRAYEHGLSRRDPQSLHGVDTASDPSATARLLREMVE